MEAVTLINYVLFLVGFYLLLGLVFSVYFLVKVVPTIDEAAQGTSLSFKLIILPGCIVFWPILLRKYLVIKKVKA
jgi:hypothetical protein